MITNFITWIKSKIHKATAPTQAQPRHNQDPTSSIEAKASHHESTMDEQDISNRRDFLSKAIVGGAGIVAGGTASASTYMTKDGVTFDDATTQITAMPDPVGEAGKVLKSDGTKAEWRLESLSGSNNNKLMFPPERKFNITYDFMSSRNNTNTQDAYPHNMNKAKEYGVISAAGGGVDNWTSYHTSHWGRHLMYHLKWSSADSDVGMNIICPANTDIIGVRAHYDAWQIFSLAKPDGTFVCSQNADNDGRIYHTAGYGHIQGFEPFGSRYNESNHHIVFFNVPRSSTDQVYVLIRGHKTDNRVGSGWVSGLSFNTNPNLYASNTAIDYHWTTNGGEATGWKDYHNWGGHNMSWIPGDQIKTLKVPVAPENPDGSGQRKLYMIGIQEQARYDHLQYVEINGNKYSFQNDYTPLAQQIMGSAGSNHFYCVTLLINNGDILDSVRINGGLIDVTFNNSNYSNPYYFTEVGTYKA